MKHTPAALTGSTRILATMLTLTERRIQQLVQLEIIPKPISGKYDLVTATQGYIRFLQRPAQSASLADARQKKVEVETQLKELDLRQRSGELVLKAVTDQEFFKLARRTRDGMLNVPARISGTLAAENDQFTIHSLLTKEIMQALGEICDEQEHTDSTKKASLAR